MQSVDSASPSSQDTIFVVEAAGQSRDRDPCNKPAYMLSHSVMSDSFGTHAL